MPPRHIPEGIVRFTHALVEDAELRSWFLSLEHVATSVRDTAFARMAEQMKADREDAELAAAVLAMRRSELFDAVRHALQERCDV